MKISLTKYAASFAVMSALTLGFSIAPAHAQASRADAFTSASQGFGSNGTLGRDQQINTGSQTMNQSGPGGNAPTLQAATNGTVGPQGSDATYVTGVNTAGTVRVNNLANLEALLNIIANGMEILGIAWGGPCMITGFMHMAVSPNEQGSLHSVLFGAAGVVGGLATPGCVNWLVASARDANLFS
jgi:hypothetical protein